MRLTLRTLLAYMDDILDPQDQADLEKRIAESELASELLHRTRDAVRRLRLGAPPAMGEGLEADPNIVAEYLDSTLTPELVADFEKMCLESDIHLAEAASCHHVLTMVLGQPADVDPALRQRMYELPTERPAKAAAAHASPVAGPAAESTIPASGETTQLSSSSKHEVPEYLRQGEGSTFGRLALAVAACLLVAAAGYFLYGPTGLLRNNRQVADNDANTPSQVMPVPEDSGDTAAVELPELEATDAAGDNTPPADSSTPPPAFDSAATAAPDESPNEVPANNANGADANGADASGTDALPPIEPLDLPPIEPLPADTAPMDEGDEGDESATATDESDTADTPGLTPPPVPNPTDNVPIADADTPMPDETDGDDETVASDPLGTFVSLHEVLLQHDRQSDAWIRLERGESILPGTTLLSLPTYRAELALVSGLRVELADATRVAVDINEAGVMFDLAYGRMLISNTGAEAVTASIVIDDVVEQLKLAPTGAVAVDVQRPFVPGMAIGQTQSPSLAMIYVPAGKVVRNEPTGVQLPIEAATQWAIAGGGASELQGLNTTPEWLSQRKLDFLQQSASRSIEQAVDFERSARVQLLGFYESTKRSEERDLAARCAVQVGQFTPFVKSLADSAQRANWENHIEMLRVAIASSPELAAKVRDAFAELRGESEASDLYEMIRGYSVEQLGTTPQELQTGVLLKLINWLEHDRLEYRVLAFHNLNQITGKSLLYQPAGSVAARDRAVRTWRQRLADNELMPSLP